MRLRFHFFTASNKFGEMIKQRVSLDLEFFRFSLKKEKKKKKIANDGKNSRKDSKM